MSCIQIPNSKRTLYLQYIFFFQVEPLFCEWIRKNIKDWQECVVVAPDEGSVKRCTSVANDLNLDFALITNRKPKGCLISESILTLAQIFESLP